MANVTFVGHDASRTGAPIVLGSLLRWLDRNRITGIRSVLIRGGPLEVDYRELVPTTLLDTRVGRGIDSINAAAASVGSRLVVADPVSMVALQREPAPDIVVANTLASVGVARRLARRGRSSPARLVCHVHELDGVATRVLPSGPDDKGDLLEAVDHFVATGEPVRSMLVDRFGVHPTRVTVVPAFIEAPCPSRRAVESGRAALRAGADGPVVLAVGAMGRRKGPERFVDLLGSMRGHPLRPCGVWLGGDPQGPVRAETVSDVERSGDRDRIRLLPAVHEPAGHLLAADVVVSTAIEDPFPLAALEAGALGIPVLGFASGGLADLLDAAGQRDGAVAVGDVLGLRDLVLRVLGDDVERSERGRGLCATVRANHVVDRVAPELWQVIQGER